MKISNEIRVGTLTLGAIIVFYVGFNYLKGEDIFSVNNSFYTVLDDISGLKESSNVTINGVVVGKVLSMHILDNQKILVALKVKSQYHLRTDARAILNQDFLGTAKMSIDLGHAPDFLQPNDTLKSFVPPSLMDKIGSLTEGEGELSKEGLIKTKKKIDLLFTSSQETISNFNTMILENQYNIKKLIINVNTLVRQTKATVEHMTPLLQNTNSLVDSLKNIRVNQSLQAFETSLSNIDQILAQLQSPKGTVGRLIKDDSIYNHLDGLLIGMQTLVNHLDEDPQHFLAPLGKSRKKILKDREKNKAE